MRCEAYDMKHDILKVLNERLDQLRFDYEQKCDSFKTMTETQLYGTMYPANAITMLTAMQDTRVRISEVMAVIEIVQSMGEE